MEIQAAVGGKPTTSGGVCYDKAPAFPPLADTTFSAPNNRADVLTVQKLLNASRISTRSVPESGICGTETVVAISEAQLLFNRSFGGSTVDGQVDPKGKTLERLNMIVEPLKLNEITQPNVEYKRGIFRISYTNSAIKKLCPPYRLLLNIGTAAPTAIKAGSALPTLEAGYSIDVSTRPNTDLLDDDNINAFLDILDAQKLWSTKAAARLILLKEGVVISISKPQEFQSLVKPYSGQLLPWDLGQMQPTLKYQGNAETEQFWGRVLYQIGNRYYFKYGPKLETDTDKHGFDCITFVGSLYLVQPVAGADNPYGNSQNLASSLNATAVSWDDGDGNKIENGYAKGDKVKKYFEVGANTGTYLFWKGSHMTLINNKTVHEFAASVGGYRASPVENWAGDSTNYHLYKLPADKQL